MEPDKFPPRKDLVFIEGIDIMALALLCISLFIYPLPVWVLFLPLLAPSIVVHWMHYSSNVDMSDLWPHLIIAGVIALTCIAVRLTYEFLVWIV